MNQPITIGRYRIKGVAYHCFFLKEVQYAVAEKTGSEIGFGSGEEVCRVYADSKQQAKEELEKCLNDKFGESGLW